MQTQIKHEQYIIYILLNEYIHYIYKYSEKEIQRCKQRIESVLLRKYNELINIYLSKKRILEQKYYEWNNKETISWFKYIENGYFNNNKYNNIFKKMINIDFDGNSFYHINELVLKLFGFNNKDINILDKHLNRLINIKYDKCQYCMLNRINTVILPCQHGTTCFDCYKNDPNKFLSCSVCRCEVDNIIQVKFAGFN